MDALSPGKHAFLAALLLLPGPVSLAALPPVLPELAVKARRSLAACDDSQAMRLAHALEERDSQQALLFRLSWLQAQASRTQPPDFDGQKHWLWSTDGETWRDERSLEAQGRTCAPPGESGPAGAVPEDLVSKLVRPYVSRYASLRPAVRKLIRSYLAQRWLERSPESLPEIPVNEAWPREEACEWKALRALHVATGEPESGDRILRECESGAGPLWTALRLQVADQALRRGAWNLAYLRYHQVASETTDTIASSTRLKYRLAISASRGAPGDAFLRISYPLLEGTDDLGEPLEPLYREVLENRICDWFGETRPASAWKVLRAVFRDERIIGGTLRLTAECRPDAAGELLNRLLPIAKSDRLRAEVLGRLIAAAAARGQRKTAESALIRLAGLSGSQPYAVKRVFWRTLEKMPALSGMAVALYRKHARWDNSDESRLKSWQARARPITPGDPAALKSELVASPEPIRLDLVSSVPDLRVPPGEPPRFITLLDEDLRDPDGARWP